MFMIFLKWSNLYAHSAYLVFQEAKVYIHPTTVLAEVYLFSLETADFSHTQIINESLMFQEFDIPSMSNNFELDKSSSIEFPI